MKFGGFFAKRGRGGAAPLGAARPPPTPCLSRGVSGPISCPPPGTAGVISMLSPKQSRRLRPRDEGAGPSRQVRFAVPPLSSQTGLHDKAATGDATRWCQRRETWA